ncbi:MULTISPECIES: NeuD/PglB/VioB family sugar acetyltransferase [unclassified Microbacterium]|uniref:NeuD/PglB/VioB family sugar acetyltransferase n=1 Tax=unclassified Microbacterium TaxID=2609290 RepID=UPI001DACE815|nr:NeuD/PglB/VioB family sugar acetyltransferase [Microbacterium sp. Bi121]CAH0133121.1 Putative acetyltransferase EpsM [Microbacterium sp. Bi121]
MPDLILLGGGGHARSVLAALLAAGESVRGYLAPEPSPDWSLPYLGDDDVLDGLDPADVRIVNGLGSIASTAARRRLHDHTIARGFTVVGVIHPRAIVDPEASIDPSAQVLAGAIVSAGATIDVDAIVNSGAIVEHDCIVEAHAHVSPGAVLGGEVRIGGGAHIGLGSRVLQGLTIGSGSVVGAGAVVISDVAPGVTVVGVPARPRPNKEVHA